MKRLKIFVLFLICSVSVLAFKMEGIAFNKSLNGGYKEFVIHNDGIKKIRYKVVLKPMGKEDVTDCLEVSPKILTIEPKSTQVLKIFGTGKRKLEEKEYPFILQFNQIIIPTLAKGKAGVTSGNSMLGLAPSIAMKGYGGTIDFSKSLELTNIRFQKDKNGDLIFEGTLTNTSYGATELAVNFYNSNRTILVSQGLGGIEAHSSIELRIPVDKFSDGKQIKYIEFYDETYNTIKQVVRE